MVSGGGGGGNVVLMRVCVRVLVFALAWVVLFLVHCLGALLLILMLLLLV